MDNSTLLNFILFLLTPAGVGAAVYVVLTKTPWLPSWFDKQMADIKRAVVMGLCLGLPLLVTGLGIIFKYLPIHQDTFYRALAVGTETYLSSQTIHLLIDLRQKARLKKALDTRPLYMRRG